MPPKQPERNAKIIAMRNENVPIKEIGKHFNMQPNTVAAVISRAIKDGTCTVFRDFEGYAKRDQEIAKLHNEGMEDAEIAAKYGMTKGGLTCLLSKLRIKGLITKEKKTHAEVGRMGGLTVVNDRVKERNSKIIELFNGNKSYGEIAAELKISRNVVAGAVCKARIAGAVTRERYTPSSAGKLGKGKEHKPISPREKKARPFADMLPPKAIVKAEQAVKQPVNQFIKVKSNLTGLYLSPKPKPPIQSVQPLPKTTTKIKIEHGIRAALPPHCKFELHNITQTAKLPRKNPEYVWCPHEIVRGSYCAEHHAVVYPARRKIPA